jgi:hypothetical protein
VLGLTIPPLDKIFLSSKIPAPVVKTQEFSVFVMKSWLAFVDIQRQRNHQRSGQ